MQPSVIDGVEVVADGEGGITLRHPRRGEVQLSGVAAAVWRQIDGARSVAELAAAAGAEESAVWAALDELGDAELLRERAAAPAGIHESVRREVVYTADAPAAADPEAAARLEAQFDASAAQGGDEVSLPAAQAAREAREDAEQDAAAQAASDEALTILGRRDAEPPAADVTAAEGEGPRTAD